jgi:arylsulfatase A-like enzyme
MVFFQKQMPVFAFILMLSSGAPCAVLAAASEEVPNNIVLFVADGLRATSVTPETAPNLARFRAEGVDFQNSHALYPTLTTANASAIATGHYLGDTGDYANTLYFGRPIWSHYGEPITFIENDVILAELNSCYGGNFLNETSLFAAARARGFATAIIGKEGPAMIQDVTNPQDGSGTIVIDDSFGYEGGVPVASGVLGALKTRGLPAQTPKTSVPDIDQETYLSQVATQAILPHLAQARAQSRKPFLLVFWSRDPDASQHGGKDSIGELAPGINGPTGKAAIRNADTAFGALMEALKSLGLDKTTNVFVTADHGFATISKASLTSQAARFANPDGAPGDLPYGFLAIDVAAGLGMPLYDPADENRAVNYAAGKTPSSGSGLIGSETAKPEIVVVANGGSDLIYLPQKNAKARAADVVSVLLKEDYVSGVFVNDRLGTIPGTLAMSKIGLEGKALTLPPDVIVNFRSFSTGCDEPLLCTVEIADTSLQTGQGMHGGFSRAETNNFMAVAGPDFQTGLIDPAPVSNADIAPTLARLLGLKLPAKGSVTGRILSESLKGGKPMAFSRESMASQPGADGLATVLEFQKIGATLYFDAAGFSGLTQGLVQPAPPAAP